MILKKYDDEFNPKSEFAAIMTCSQADGGCPLLLALKAYSNYI
jgi:arsenate reductase